MSPTSIRPKDGFCILLCLFSCALLLHIGSGSWSYQKTTAFLLITIGLQFLNYRLWWATVLAAISFAALMLPKFPRLANHANIETGVCLLLFIVVIAGLSGYRFRNIKAETITLTFRYTLIALYFLAGFHKLNSGFFNMDGSCADFIDRNLNTVLLGWDFIKPPALITISQIMTIIAEMLVPFGLLHHKTRRIAAWILVLFHFYLTLCDFSNFSSFAGFLIAGSLLDLSKENYSAKLILALRVYLFFSIASAITAYATSRFSLVEGSLIRFCSGIVFNIGWIYFFSVVLQNTKAARTTAKFTIVPYLAVMVVLIWGTQCYIGLSNAGNLTMFSNLITEKSRSNHLLINTTDTKIWDFEEDLVTIVTLPENIKWEGQQEIRGYDLPLVEFKTQAAKWVKEDSLIPCSIIYKDRLIHIPNLADSEFSKVKWWYKFLLFRKIPPKGHNECLW